MCHNFSSSQCLTTSRLATIRRHFPWKRIAQFLARPCGHRQNSSTTTNTVTTTTDTKISKPHHSHCQCPPTPTSSRIPRSQPRSSTPSSRSQRPQQNHSLRSDSLHMIDQEMKIPDSDNSDDVTTMNVNCVTQCPHPSCSSHLFPPLRVAECQECVRRLYLAMIARFCVHDLQSSCEDCSHTRNAVRVYFTSALLFFKRQQLAGGNVSYGQMRAVSANNKQARCF